MTLHNPTEPTFGLGELVRAQRLYLGLSQRELSRQIPMDRRTYQRIEGGTVPCPTGFLNTMSTLIDTFDREVEQTIEVAERMGAIGPGSAKIMDVDPSAVHFRVDAEEDIAHVWTRAVIGRAAVDSGLIMPTLVSDMNITEAVIE